MDIINKNTSLGRNKFFKTIFSTHLTQSQLIRVRRSLEITLPISEIQSRCNEISTGIIIYCII